MLIINTSIFQFDLKILRMRKRKPKKPKKTYKAQETYDGIEDKSSSLPQLFRHLPQLKWCSECLKSCLHIEIACTATTPPMPSHLQKLTSYENNILQDALLNPNPPPTLTLTLFNCCLWHCTPLTQRLPPL